MTKETHEAALKRILAAQGWEIYSDERGLAIGHLDALINENTDLKIQLKPDTEPAEPGLPLCPFCGCDKLFTTSMPRFPGLPREWDGSMSYTVACGGCAAHGGWEKSLSGARRSWSMRNNAWQKRCEKIAEILAPAVEHHANTKDHCNLCEIYTLATGTDNTPEEPKMSEDHGEAILLAIKWIAEVDKSGNPVMAKQHALAMIAEIDQLKTALRKAAKILNIAADWHLDEVEVDGKMRSTSEIASEFQALAGKP